MSLGIFSRGVGAYYPQPQIDLGPECVPGFPCSEAAEDRRTLERGLAASLRRARRPVDPFAPTQNDPDVVAYQEAVQDLAHRNPEYASTLVHHAGTAATMATASAQRHSRLSRSPALQGPYYMVPSAPATLIDMARTGVPYRVWR
jgi:hypothetical protein